MADRVARLELSTKFRPVHIGVLFVALAPSVLPQDDFYAPLESKGLAEPFLEALEIHSLPDKVSSGVDTHATDSTRLAEFQRRGYYLAYLSECPIPKDKDAAASAIARLSPTLIRRIRFNYRPKCVAPLGQELFPLVGILKVAGIGPILTLDPGTTLPTPRTGDGAWLHLFQKALANAAPGENPGTGYDRINLTSTERE